MPDNATFSLENIDRLAAEWSDGIVALNADIKAEAFLTGRWLAAAAWANWRAKVGQRPGSPAVMMVQDTERDKTTHFDITVPVVSVWMAHNRMPNIPLWMEFGTKTHRTGRGLSASVAVTGRNWLAPAVSMARPGFTSRITALLERAVDAMNGR